MKKTKKKLFRSKKNRILTGVLGGVGEMLSIDPTIIRIVYLILTAMMGFAPGIVIYFITSLIVPEKKK